MIYKKVTRLIFKKKQCNNKVNKKWQNGKKQ